MDHNEFKILYSSQIGLKFKEFQPFLYSPIHFHRLKIKWTIINKGFHGLFLIISWQIKDIKGLMLSPSFEFSFGSQLWELSICGP